MAWVSARVGGLCSPVARPFTGWATRPARAARTRKRRATVQRPPAWPLCQRPDAEASGDRAQATGVAWVSARAGGLRSPVARPFTGRATRPARAARTLKRRATRAKATGVASVPARPDAEASATGDAKATSAAGASARAGGLRSRVARPFTGWATRPAHAARTRKRRATRAKATCVAWVSARVGGLRSRVARPFTGWATRPARAARTLKRRATPQRPSAWPGCQPAQAGFAPVLPARSRAGQRGPPVPLGR